MLNHVRRVVAVVLTALVLLAVPQIADAAFSGRAAPRLSVGTATLNAPQDVVGTRECLDPRGLTAKVSGFTWDGPDGAVFRYSIYRGTSSTPFVTGTSTSRSVTITTRAQQSGSDVWRLAVSVELKGWTSPEWSRTYTC